MKKMQDQVDAVAKRLNLENKNHDIEMAGLRKKAQEEALKLVKIMAAKLPGIKQIWGFGSVFETQRPFCETSDINLAIEGADLFAAIKIAESSPFKVDIIDITGESGRFSELIRKYGKPLI